MPVANINEVSASESFPWPKAGYSTHNVNGTVVVGILTDDYLGSGFHIVSSASRISRTPRQKRSWFKKPRFRVP